MKPNDKVKSSNEVTDFCNNWKWIWQAGAELCISLVNLVGFTIKITKIPLKRNNLILTR